MTLPLIAERSIDQSTQLKRTAETINAILRGEWINKRTSAEKIAGIYPVDYTHPPGDVRRYGAAGDGVTDDSAAIQRAFTVAGAMRGRVHFPALGSLAETVYCCNGITVGEGVHVTADAGVIVEKNGGAWTTHIFDCISTLGAATLLTANTAKRDATVAVTSATGLAVGQLVLIRDAQYKWSTNGRNLEFNEIASISGLNITLKNRLIGAYLTASTAELVPVTAPARSIRFEGVHCRIPVGEDGGAFYFEEAYDCEVNGCVSVGQKGQAGVQVWRSAYIRVNGGEFRDGQDQSTPGYGYGIVFAQSSHHCVARGVVTRNVRENACSIGSRFCGFVDCEAHSSYDNGFNTHADGNEDCYFENCRSYFARSKGFYAGGVTAQAPDKRVRFVNCESHYSGYLGFWAEGASGVEPEDVTFENCRAFHFGDDTALSYGFYVFRSKRARLINCHADANGEANARGLVKLELSTDAVVRGGKFRGATGGWGILHENCTGVTIEGGVDIGNIGANQGVHAEGTASTGVVVRDVRVDNDTGFTFNTADLREQITYATKLLRNKGAAAAVADGGTITHGLISTPTSVRAVGSVAAEFISVTAVGSTTFTVAIKKHDGTAGTAQTIYWDADL